MYTAELSLLYTRKLDTSCQAMRQKVMPAKSLRKSLEKLRLQRSVYMIE